MQDLLEFLVKNITGEGSIKIVAEEAEGFTNYKIISPKEFVGILVGKEGRTIRAIRNILKVKATLEGRAVGVSVEEATS